ncbi:hypothetical protein CTI14_40410, partial [Methylobacterium radiotolerans]
KRQLDREGFSEVYLQRAYASVKQVDAAASIIGFLRAAAEDEAPQPFEARVDAALARLLGSSTLGGGGQRTISAPSRTFVAAQPATGCRPWSRPDRPSDLDAGRAPGAGNGNWTGKASARSTCNAPTPASSKWTPPQASSG